MYPCWEYRIPTWTILQWLARDEKDCLSTVIIGRRYLLLRKCHWMHVFPRTESLCWWVSKQEGENSQKKPDTGQTGGYFPCPLYLSKGLDTWWGHARQLNPLSELYGRTFLVKQTRKCLQRCTPPWCKQKLLADTQGTLNDSEDGLWSAWASCLSSFGTEDIII